MLRSESGYPYIMFQDNVNKVHANNHISKVKFSNLCSEVRRHLRFLHTQTMMKKMKSVWIFPATWVRLTFSTSWSTNQSKRQLSLQQTL
ncbi:hypothetical protein KQR57_10005 [Bacillus inaquosorum]|nr:hypothetical protein [Bacillus inaquosorum]